MERNKGAAKPDNTPPIAGAKAAASSARSSKDEPLVTAGAARSAAHEHMPKAGDRSAVSVTETGGVTVRTSTPAPHAGETGAPVIPPAGETPGMGAPVQPDRENEDEGDERPQADPEIPALGEWEKRRGPDPGRA